MLAWLETFNGSTWQQRWVSSRAEQAGRRRAEVPTQFTVDTEIDPPTLPIARRAIVQGLQALLCLGVVRPSYEFLFSSRLTGTYDHIRELTDELNQATTPLAQRLMDGSIKEALEHKRVDDVVS